MSERAAESALLAEGVALSVEAVSKDPSDIHEARYRPAVSVFARLQERRGRDGDGRGVPTGPGAEDAGDEDDEDDEIGAPAVEAKTSPLAEISFEVRCGEALGIVGRPHSAVRTLTRVLSGMSAPSAGRLVVRGRIGPTVELATLLTSGETNVRAVARRLAGLAGPGRKQRGVYVREALGLAFADEPHVVRLAQPPKPYLRRAAVAAALDPFADVLVVDALPDFGDPDFPERCLERIKSRLDSGAAAVVACEDVEVIRTLCSRVVWLDGESVGGIGSLDEALAALAEPEPAPPVQKEVAPVAVAEPVPAEPVAVERRKPRRDKGPLRWFDEHAALVSVRVVDTGAEERESFGGDEDMSIRVAFELAIPALVRVVIRLIGEETLTFLEDFPLEGGTHVAELRLSTPSIAPDDYDVAGWLIFEHEDGRTKIGRAPATRVTVTFDESLLPLELEGVARAVAAPSDDELEWTIETAGPGPGEPRER